jgi:hypothetical protein
MPRRRLEEPEKRVRSEVRENLECRCRGCSYCHGQGLVTVYHDMYTGLPYVTLKDRFGRARLFSLRGVVNCICPLGFFFGQAQDPEDATASRFASLKLQHVLEGMDGRRLLRWSTKDPTLPTYDESEVIEPGDFRALFYDMVARLKRTTGPPKALPRPTAEAAF